PAASLDPFAIARQEGDRAERKRLSGVGDGSLHSDSAVARAAGQDRHPKKQLGTADPETHGGTPRAGSVERDRQAVIEPVQFLVDEVRLQRRATANHRWVSLDGVADEVNGAVAEEEVHAASVGTAEAAAPARVRRRRLFATAA